MTTTEEWVAARDDGIRLMDTEDYAAAIQALQRAVEADPTGHSHALLAIAHFQLTQYALAAQHYAAALERDPANADWQLMRDRAQANATARIDVFVPDVYYFDRVKLLAAPTLRHGILPEPLPPRRRGLLKRLRLTIGSALGAVVSLAVAIATKLVGRTFGYRAKVWTNWYRRPFVFGILTLAFMREQLNKDNLKTTYPKGSLVGFQTPGQSPPPGVTHFRTADGSWNNLADPKEGAAGTRFPRNIKLNAIRPESGQVLMTPNPREVSRLLLTREGAMKEVPFLNLLAAAWINFENHDWIDHGETLADEVYEIPLAEDDPARRRYRQASMLVGKTQGDPTRRADLQEPAATFVNEVTHWWDGSQIYGSDQETVDRLRSHVGGELRLSPDGTLPVSGNGVEETGFVRNWWVGLAMFHTLFAREHNAICDRLHQAYPTWDDNRLFNVARLINAAVMAKIHSVEWTPAILPNRGLDAGLNANWYGLLTNLFKTGKRRRSVAEINIRNPEMGGVVGNPINKHGEPFGLTEEFVEVYRLHSLLPESITITRIGASDASEELSFPEVRQAASAKITQRVSMPDLFFSFGILQPGQLVLNNFPRFMQEMSIPSSPLFDMGAVDILRARERGVPRYNEFRRQLGLNPIRSFEDLTDEQDQVAKLKQVYGEQPEDVEKLDLMIGTLAEGHRPTHFGFGETLFQIFILNASRRLQADRFYTDCYNEDVYTKEGLQWIDDADLKAVLLRHYPELSHTGLANVKNAFEPWDDTARLGADRHPLRAYDRELAPDPWIGDAFRST